MTETRRKELEEEIADLRQEAEDAGNNADSYEREERRLDAQADKLQEELDAADKEDEE